MSIPNVLQLIRRDLARPDAGFAANPTFDPRITMSRFRGVVEEFLVACGFSQHSLEREFGTIAQALEADWDSVHPPTTSLRQQILGLVWERVCDKPNVTFRNPEPGQCEIRLAMDSQHEPLRKMFQLIWRQRILEFAWDRLAEQENRTGKPYFTVLRRHHEMPCLTIDRLLTELVEVFEEVPSKQAFRVFLIRSRVSFSKAVVSEVLDTLWNPSLESLDSELRDLRLSHFGEVLEHWSGENN